MLLVPCWQPPNTDFQPTAAFLSWWFLLPLLPAWLALETQQSCLGSDSLLDQLSTNNEQKPVCKYPSSLTPWGNSTGSQVLLMCSKLFPIVITHLIAYSSLANLTIQNCALTPTPQKFPRILLQINYLSQSLLQNSPKLRHKVCLSPYNAFTLQLPPSHKAVLRIRCANIYAELNTLSCTQ